MDFESLAAKLQGNRIRIHIFYCGRKNYMFCCNYESAENMCVIQSLLATCRNHDVNPRLYLNSVIASMPYFDKASEEDLIQLLPHRWKRYHPEAVMTTPVRQLAK